MKKQLAYYKPSLYEVKFFIGIAALFLILRVIFIDSALVVILLLITAIVAAGFIFVKLIGRLSYFKRYHSVEFDQDCFYYKSNKTQYDIPLGNVKAIKLKSPLYEYDYRLYRIEYWEQGVLCRTDIRVSEKYNDALLAFQKLVLKCNPSVEIENSWPNDFSLMNKFTDKLNRFSEKVFPPKELP
jgi:hypothetical protein